MKKNDLLIIAIILVLALAFFGYERVSRKNEVSDVLYADIYYDGQLYEHVPLAEEKTVTIEKGNVKNVIQIKNNSVYMVEANCPDNICVDSGPIDSVRENIVCLPNKVYVVVKGEAKEIEVDVIAE